MTTTEVANRLVELCRDNKWEQCIQELYSPEILSIEPEGSTLGTVQGLEAIAQKAKQWEGMIEQFHSGEISDPIVAENFFSITMKSKVTMKGMSESMDMDEVCVYRVDNGKVVTEQFFYTPLPVPA